MKSSLILTAAIAALTLLGVSSPAEARSRHKHSCSHVYTDTYRSCGRPVRTERYLIGYDRCGYPVWGYRTVRHYCPPPRTYYRRPAYCPPPYPYYGHRSRGGVVISGSFRL